MKITAKESKEIVEFNPIELNVVLTSEAEVVQFLEVVDYAKEALEDGNDFLYSIAYDMRASISKLMKKINPHINLKG